MTDRYTVTTQRGCFSSIGGVFVGIVLLIASVPLLFWNEGRAVETYNSLAEGSAAVINVSADAINPANEGKLVYVNGLATTNATLNDPDFRLSTKAIKLIRDVQMYQWKESSETKTNGNTKTTTYTYSKEWSSTDHSSKSFNQSSGHENPEMLYKPAEYVAQNVTLQAFTLSTDLIKKTSGAKPLAVDSLSYTVPSLVKDRTQVADGFFYIGNGTLPSPQVGDLQVKFNVIEPTVVSVVAKQSSNRLVSYQTKAGEAIALLTMGTSSAAELFKKAQDENSMMTWLLRGGGMLAMFIGAALILGPLTTMISFVPLLGGLVERALLGVVFAITVLLSGIVIAIAWLTYHPLIGIAILGITLLGFGLVIGGVVVIAGKRK